MKIPCKIFLAAAALAVGTAGAYAQSSMYSLSQFEGGYVGGYVGAQTNDGFNTTAGVAAGVNFAVTDGVNVGAEVQGGGTFKSDGTEFDALMLGRAGMEIDDNTMVYGAVGGGLIDGTGSYAVGGGAEAIVTDQIGVRGELLGTGKWGNGLNGAKATAGVMWHVR